MFTHKMAILVALGVLGACPALHAQLEPKLSVPIVAGQKKISATVHAPGKWKVTVTAPAVPPAAAISKAKLVEITASNPGLITFDFSEEEFVAAKKEGFKADYAVQLSLEPAATALDKATVVANSAKVFLQPPHEGDQVVRGTVFGTADKVRVEVFSAEGNPVDLDTASVAAGATDDPGKQFTSGLNRRLAAGQLVRITTMNGDAETGANTDFAVVQTSGFDWGRVRAYFSAGATLAQKNVDTSVTTGTGTSAVTTTTRDRPFQSTDYFVGLSVDYNWYSNLTNRLAPVCARPAKAAEELAQLEFLINRWDKNSLDKRVKGLKGPDAAKRADDVLEELRGTLTRVTTDLKSANSGPDCLVVEKARIALLTSAAKGLDAGSGEKTLSFAFDTGTSAGLEELKQRIERLKGDIKEYRKGDPNEPQSGRMFNTSFEGRLGQAPVAGAEGPAAPAAILQKANAGYIGMDFYAPLWYRGGSWRFHDRFNALFIAPLGRVGMLSASNGPVDLVNNVEKTPLFRHLYGSYSFGMRFGHFGLDQRGKEVAPELISYLDVTYGRFDNFRRLTKAFTRDGADNVTSVQENLTNSDLVPWRTEITGRFKVPETPLYVGFTANIGRGPDDIRFFFGTRFDLSRALSKLIPSN